MSDPLINLLLLSSPAFNYPMNMLTWHEPEGVYYSVGAGMVLLADLVRKPFKYTFSFQDHTFSFETDQTVFLTVNALDLLKPHALETTLIPVPADFYDDIKKQTREGDEWKMADFDFTTWPFMWKFNKSVEQEIKYKLEGLTLFKRDTAEEPWGEFRKLPDIPEMSKSTPSSPSIGDVDDFHIDLGTDPKPDKKPPSGNRH